VYDATDHPAITNAWLAPRVGRKVRFKPPELLVDQQEIPLIQQESSFGSLESGFAGFKNPVYGSQP